MRWRYFAFRQIREAEEWAESGGAAVHHTGFPFRRWKLTAHLFCPDTATLRRMSREIGCNPKWIQYEGTDREHIDIFGGPLTNALALCDNGEGAVADMRRMMGLDPSEREIVMAEARGADAPR